MRMKERKKFRWVALKLCLVLLAIFILQIIFPAITENFSLTASEVWEKPWLLLSAIFLHGSITHLLFNLFSLFLFGSFRGTCCDLAIHARICSRRTNATYCCCHHLDARRSCWILIILTRHARRDCERSAHSRTLFWHRTRDCVEEGIKGEENAGKIKRILDNFLN